MSERKYSTQFPPQSIKKETLGAHQECFYLRIACPFKNMWKKSHPGCQTISLARNKHTQCANHSLLVNNANRNILAEADNKTSGTLQSLVISVYTTKFNISNSILSTQCISVCHTVLTINHFFPPHCIHQLVFPMETLCPVVNKLNMYVNVINL
jgi:hypothetical protein